MEAVSYGYWGVAGFLTYHIEDIRKQITIGYEVSYNGYKWDVKMHQGIINCTVLENSSRERADDQWHEGDLGFGLKYRVFMSTSPQATSTLNIQIVNSK